MYVDNLYLLESSKTTGLNITCTTTGFWHINNKRFSRKFFFSIPLIPNTGNIFLASSGQPVMNINSKKNSVRTFTEFLYTI